MPRRSLPSLTILALALLLAPARARAIVLYSSVIGWRFASSTGPIDTGFSFKGNRLEPTTSGARGLLLSRRGALCPAAGTPDFLCAEAFSAAGDAGGRLTLRSSTRLVRSGALGLGVDAVYADTTVSILNLGVVGVAPPVANAYVVFGLSGTRSLSASDPSVTTAASAVATLDGAAVQCAGLACEPVRFQNWTPQSLRLNLRTDVAVAAPDGLPFDAEVVADFADTFELLAIALHDENDQPIPGAAVVVTDGNGNTLQTIPSSAPETTTTTTLPGGSTSTSTTSTSTTSPEGTTTTSTLAGGCPAGATFTAIACRLEELAELAERDGGPLAAKLLARLDAARSALTEGAAGGTVRVVARAFKRVRKQLAGVKRLVRTKKAQRLLPEAARDTLLAATEQLIADVRRLAATPPD